MGDLTNPLRSRAFVSYYASMKRPEITKYPYMILTIGAVGTYLIAIALFVFNIKNLPGTDLILQFSRQEGIKTLGEKIDLAFIVGISGLMLTINLVLAETFYFKERVISLLVMLAGILLSIFTLIAAGLIISIN